MRQVLPTPLPTPLMRSLPVYALYGETGRREATDWLHVESIAERSRLHNWEIRPHRHELLHQLLVLQRGRAVALLDGGEQLLQGPCVLGLPALVPHGFRFDPAVQGVVITVLDAHLRRLLAGQPALLAALTGLPVQPWHLAGRPDAARAVASAVVALMDEAACSAAWRDVALDAALIRLAVVLGRLPDGRDAVSRKAFSHHTPYLARSASTTRNAAPADRAQGHVGRFQALVEAHFRRQPTLAVLAAELGITPTQLNRVCRQVLGHAAQEVLHARLVLEAQRELAFSNLAVKQIAHGLGFADAAYFSRFFQRHCGRTPSAWRAQAGR